ncbi:MAG: flagellar export chaperone FliS [Nitrospirae bacterium]|nr:flagellar export chaperone FliS [Candidatus Troglogloeales bacterium]
MSPHSSKVYYHYQESNVALSSPEGLIVLLYAEFLCCLIVAKEAFVTNDRFTRNKNMTKAVEILVELMGSLNMGKGEQVGLYLATLYEYIAGRLLRLRHEPNIALFDEVISLIIPLKEAWETIAFENSSLIKTATQ